MAFTYWLVLALLGTAVGWFLVISLTASPVNLTRAVALALGAAFTSVGLLLWQFSDGYLVVAIGVLIASMAVGYWACAKRVLGRDDTRSVPTLTRTPGDPGDGHTAVVYFTHGEPETYDPIGWLNQFREFDDQGIAFVPFLARPFFLRSLRHAYLTVGSSQHRARHLGMAARLEQLLREEHTPDIRVYPSFLDDNPRPDAAVIDALNDGASQIIVAEVFVSISNHTKEGEELVRAVDADQFNVPVRFTGPLWDSGTLHRMFLDKIEVARGQVPADRVGVLLVGHGQPDEWDVEWPTETEHELALRRSVLELLAANGYRREKIDLAWMEFKEPRVAHRASELARSDIDLLVYFSAGISAESIHSQYDVPKLMSRAQVPPDVAVLNLGAWNDHPLTIQAIAEKVDRLMRIQHQESVIAAAE